MEKSQTMNQELLGVPVSYIEKLEGMPRGLRLVRYGGGDSFRSAREILQHQISSSFIPEDLKNRIYETQKFKPEECSWEYSFSISTNILGDDDYGAVYTKVNLYFHGWLFENEVLSGASASQKYPLIGLFSPIVGFREYEDKSLMGNTASAGFNFLRSSDQHIHTVDPFAGGTSESYIALLIESGMSRQDAEAIATIEAMEINQYYMGSDSARVSLKTDIPINQAWVVCVERTKSKIKIFVVFLLVITSNKLLNELENISKTELISSLLNKEEFQQFNSVLSNFGLHYQ